MPVPTKSLVGTVKKYLAPVLLSAACVVAVVNYSGVHAAMDASSSAPPLNSQSVAALTSLDKAMEALSAHFEPSVVNIAVTSMPTAEDTSQQEGQQQDQQDDQGAQQRAIPSGLQQFFGSGGQVGQMQQQPQPQQLEHGIGSGVIISPDGYILSNNHVVDGAKYLKVTLHDRRVLNGRVVGVDKLTDLAVVKVNATNLPAISWDDSSVAFPIMWPTFANYLAHPVKPTGASAASDQACPIARFSRAVSTTSTESVSRPLMVRTRCIWVSSRTSRRKLPRVSRMMAVITSGAGDGAGICMPTGAHRCSKSA